MKAEIIAIGSELTCGSRLDTNSQWLSQELEALGWTVHRHTTVADDHVSMIRIYREAAERSRVVLITGGLGPTLDDITRETLAAAFDQPLVEDALALAHIEALFRSRGREMPERNRVQAQRPRDAITLHNAHGTAPGILMHLTNPECTIGVMPGVPAEMKRMFQEQLRGQLPHSPVFVRRTVLRTFGYGESDAEKLLGDLTARGRNPEVGITASKAVISLSITSRAGSEKECQLLSDGVRQQILERLGDAVFGESDDELSAVVSRMMAFHHVRVALLEGTTTGGLMTTWLTEDENSAANVVSSRVFAGLKAESLSDQWYQSLNEEIQRLFLEDHVDCILLSSPTQVVCGDDGIRRQTGMVTIVTPEGVINQDVSMTGNLAIFRQRAAGVALNLLRLRLKHSQQADISGKT
ncbi:MAG: damage-inducible protein CinA [Planctomycetaceae bacterium]|nr:damage-inducible protein CinA [Planctomycetaceae bacterium]